ncbi:hypothetical protein EIP91_003558 [Steccherinum ochraceum]|uniref:AB hydrolase-1 domain-containing protein n=1 Tax=Steccherinum ochraceum TaxID=92696 RepID=A0A4R0RR05_9APHY|nr:hypothetical protein EIP91_003558 [Steccherinum ochraceum]
MAPLHMTPYGALAIYDSGAPEGAENYTTLVVMHGLVFTIASFAPLLQYVRKYNVRLILVNRRGYPGTMPFNEEDMAQLKVAYDGPSPESANAVRAHLQARVKEIYELLASLILKEDIKENSIILSAWSLGTMFINSFLAYGPNVAVGNVNVVAYIKRVTVYDAPFICMGYPPYAGGYSPIRDPELSAEEGIKRFPFWVSGYYKHGSTVSELEVRNALPTPKATFVAMSANESIPVVYSPPGAVDGSDFMLAWGAIKNDTFVEVKDAALKPEKRGDQWAKIPWRHIWGDHSIWEVVYGQWQLEKDIAATRKSGSFARPIEAIRLPGCNHFAQWDCPEELLRAFLDVDANGRVEVL